MKKLLFIFVSLFVSSANATLLDFEELGPGNFGSLTTSQGFTINSNADWVNDAYNTGENAHASDYAMRSWVPGGSIVATDGSDFIFDGLFSKRWATTSANPASERDVRFSGWNNGVEVWGVTLGLNNIYQALTGQAGAIDELKYANVGTYGTTFLIDDIQLNAVPVPAAVWLFGTGLLGLIGARKKQSISA